MMGKRFLLLLVLAVSLFAAEPFEGTWKLNVAKSKHGGGPLPAAKEETTVVAVADGQFSVTVTGTAADGSPILIKYRVPTTGGPVQFLEGGPPPDSGITSTLAKRKADSNTIATADAKDGKVYETAHSFVSADGKTLHATAKGVDFQGKKYENVEVLDKQ